MSRYILVIILFAAVFLVYSCDREYVVNKVPVSITFLGPSGETEGSADIEGMKTLRVIVAKSATNDIVFNFNNPVNADGSSNVNIKLLPDTYDFYFIANYESAGITDIDNPTLSSLDEHILNTEDPNTYVVENGIPFGEIRKGVKVVEGAADLFGNNDVIEMKRSLAKVSLKFVNETGSEVQLQDLKIAGAKAPSGYLFEQEQDDEMDEAEDLIFDGTISAEGTSIVKYIYPVKKAETDTSPFVLTAKWNNVLNETILKEGMTSITRNTHVDITITLKQDGNFEMKTTLLPWEDGGESDILYGEKWDGVLNKVDSYPYFTGGDSESGKYYMLSYGEGNVANELVFQLTATSPLGATWTANVTNGLDFEVVKTEDDSWASGGIDGNRVLITVRAKRPYQIGIIRETDLYITLTENMLNQGEQIINTAGNGTAQEHPGTETHIKIRQVSPDEINKLIQQ